MTRLLKICNTISSGIIIIFIGCSSINDPIERDKENLIAFSAIYYTDNDYSGRIVIMDYKNPTNYKIITHPGLKALEPIFSHNKEKILFGLDGISEHGYQFAVYDINTSEMEKLYANNISDGLPLVGTNPVWDLNNEGFYFTQHHTYSIAMGIYYYDLTTEELTELYNPQDASIYAVGIKAPDTLIVFSNKYYLASKDSNCFFFMSKSGEYISQITNPHLVLINENGVTKKGAYDIYWNHQIKQFVYSAINTDQIGYAISATDIEGTFYKQYTNSNYDTRPIWGPNNSILYFNRQPDLMQKKQLYFINTISGSINQFIDPSVINGAVQIVDATY